MYPERVGTALFYAQHLSGVGHHVRAWEIAAALARFMDVHLTAGGCLVPRSPSPSEVNEIVLPALVRRDGKLRPASQNASLADVMRARARCLAEKAAELRPDLVVIEHYPFSKWELEAEIRGLLAAARRHNPNLLVVCSVRDVVRKTVHEALPQAQFEERVVARLHRDFDRLLVHADPELTSLFEYFASATRLRIPVSHTGIVSKKLGADERRERGTGLVVCSFGGGRGADRLANACMDAWRLLKDDVAYRKLRLELYAGLHFRPEELSVLRRKAEGIARVFDFTPRFLEALFGAELSISRAGYNTCANLLEAGTRGLLIPDPTMSDQETRARRLVSRGWAGMLSDSEASPRNLAAAISNLLNQPRPLASPDLEGADRTARLLASWVQRCREVKNAAMEAGLDGSDGIPP